MLDESRARGTQSQLSSRIYLQLGNFVHRQSSIRLPLDKKFMVEGRLRKRLQYFNFACLDDYVDWVLSSEGKEEQIHLIDALTTNKTDFFREAKHFDYLHDELLPELVKSGVGNGTAFHAWSAACSNGAEPYTLSMVVQEWMRINRRINFAITASDISVSMLKKATSALYGADEISGIPDGYKKRYLLRHKSDDNIFKIDKATRKHVTFKMVNLNANHYDVPSPLHLILCRNVLIYFDHQCKANIIKRFYNQLSRGGVLMIGHSETISDVDVPFTQLAPTIYQRTE